MTPWERLGVDPDADVAAIRRAYARRLRDVRPDEDAAAFQSLREARDAAIAAAERKASRAAELAAFADAATAGEGGGQLGADADADRVDPVAAGGTAGTTTGDADAEEDGPFARGAPEGGVPSAADERVWGTLIVPLRLPPVRAGVRGESPVAPLRPQSAPPAADTFRGAAAALRQDPERGDRWMALRLAVQELSFDRAGEAEATVIDLLRLLPERPPLAVAREVARLAVLFGWDDSDAPLRQALGRDGAAEAETIIAAGRADAPWGPRTPPPLPTGRPVTYDRNGIVDVPPAALALLLGPFAYAAVDAHRNARLRGRWRPRFVLTAFLFGGLWLSVRGAWRAAFAAWALTTVAWVLFLLDTTAVPRPVAVAGEIAGPVVWVLTRLGVALSADRLSVGAAARALAAGRTEMGTAVASLGFLGWIVLLVRGYVSLLAPMVLAFVLIGALSRPCWGDGCPVPPPPGDAVPVPRPGDPGAA